MYLIVGSISVTLDLLLPKRHVDFFPISDDSQCISDDTIRLIGHTQPQRTIHGRNILINDLFETIDHRARWPSYQECYRM